jgi:beta-RFAP synthase
MRVRTPSRLHFGLLSLAGEQERWPDRQGQGVVPARRFGGVGLMVQQPGVEVCAEPGVGWSAGGALAGRALAFARQVAEALEQERPGCAGPPLRLRVPAAAPEHMGLGTGTQLGLAVARVVAESWEIKATVRELARWSCRGGRSALGVHGFERGGLLVEAGRGAGEGLAPLAARQDFPQEWRIVLAIRTAGGEGLHGTDESEAFARLGQRPSVVARTDALCRLALLGLLPAAGEGDLEAFGEALYDFNRRAGELFAPVQGGLYASAAVAEMVAFVRGHGVRGVGQSSWGPTVFAIVGDEERAKGVADLLRKRFGLGPVEVIITKACNAGAAIFTA